jgi:hypothetical protein
MPSNSDRGQLLLQWIHENYMIQNAGYHALQPRTTHTHKKTETLLTAYSENGRPTQQALRALQPNENQNSKVVTSSIHDMAEGNSYPTAFSGFILCL